MHFINAYNKASGQKVRVPAHFFDFPSLSRNLSKTPRQQADEQKPRRKSKASEPVALSDSAPVEASTTTPAAGDRDEE